jgi:hypothetical protein
VSNILLDGANWYDGNYGHPPSYWNGSVYDYIGNIGTQKYFYGATMQYIGTIAAGDIISLSIKSTSADPTKFGITVNGASVFSQILATGVVYTFASSALSSGDTIIVNVGVGDSLYSQDAILTPVANPTPVAPTPCTDLGRVSRCYVSAFTRNRVHRVDVMAQEKRCIVANFNGAMEAARSIASVVFSVDIPTYVKLTNCDITGRETACLMLAQWRGHALVRCSATMDNGDVYTQYFDVYIGGTYFHGDVIGSAGPYQISATA